VATAECLLYTSNALLALLHEDIDRLPAADRDLVHGALPWTVLVADRPVTRDGSTHDLAGYALARQAGLVLKPLHGHSGRGVLFGGAATAGQWSAALENAYRDGGFCLQERVSPDTAAVPVYDSRSGTLALHELPYVLGPYLLGRHRGGICVRHPAPGSAEPGINWESGVLHSVALTT
jgi:hypothetical protein